MRLRSVVQTALAAAALLILPSAATAAPEPLAARLAAAAAAEAVRPGDLDRLMRLQLAAGRWIEAEATLDRLAAAYRTGQPMRAGSVVPWRVYARARRHEAGGLSRADALRRAFDEVLGAASDEAFADALPWFAPGLDRLRETQAQAQQGCAGLAVDACPQAAALVAARQSLATWVHLTPAVQPLLRAEAERRFLVEEALVPAAGGAQVAAILVRPRGGTGRLTALLNFTIYARDDWALSDAVAMAAHGYAGVVAYSRGKGRTAGQAVPYEHDGADAAAVIDWLAARPWSDGRVGMFSGSYNASTQWAALKHRPRALKAIATNATNAPGVDAPMQGNVFRNFSYPWLFYATGAPSLDDITYGDRARWRALDRTWYVTGRRYRDLELIDGQPNPVWLRWLDHPGYDAFWQALAPVGEEFARIDIPVFAQTGYFDGGMVGALHFAREHYRHRPNAEHRLLIGPYGHFAMTQGVTPSINGYDIDPVAMLDLRAVRMQWFDHVFRGRPLPEILSGRVNFQVMGADAWRHVDSLDAMADRPLRLFLGGESRDGLLAFGETRPAPDAPAPELKVDFADRSDVDVEVPWDQLDARNALVFATRPFAGPVEVAGGFTGRFEAVVNKRDLDLQVTFFEQRADGRYSLLASYLGRASYMADRSRRRLLTPGRPQVLSFESQTVTARRLAAGSRLIALVGVPRQPDMQINYGTGRDVSDESVADAGEPLRLLLRPGSYLELKVRR